MIKKRCTILDAWTMLTTADPMGSVSGDTLLLEGHMNRVILGADKSYLTYAPDNVRLNAREYLDRQEDDIDSASELYLFSLCSTSKITDMKVLGVRRRLDIFSYLILSPVRNRGRAGTYERRGLAHAFYHGHLEYEGISYLWETRPGQDEMIRSEGGVHPERGYRIRVIWIL